MRDRKRFNPQKLSPPVSLLALVVILLLPPVLLGSHPGAVSTVTAPAQVGSPPQPPPAPQPAVIQGPVLPAYRVVALSGAPQAPQLGGLGSQTPEQAVRQLGQLTGALAQPGRPVLGAFELVATVATPTPGPDGRYRLRQPDNVVRDYLNAARRARALLILDIEPGRSDFNAEIQAFRPYIEQPDVGLALEPARQLGPTGQPSPSIDANQINGITLSIADTVHRLNLAQKLVIVHELAPGTIRDQRALRPAPGVALVLSAANAGNQQAKLATYRGVTAQQAGFFSGMRLFLHQDRQPLTASQLLRLRPPVDFVDYR